MKALEDKVNELAGDKVFDSLRSCLDRAISDDYTERVAATREAQEILDCARRSGLKERPCPS